MYCIHDVGVSNGHSYDGSAEDYLLDLIEYGFNAIN